MECVRHSLGRACFLKLSENKKCKGLNKVTAQCFKTFGPIPSIPVALFGFNEDKALKTSASEIVIETK